MNSTTETLSVCLIFLSLLRRRTFYYQLFFHYYAAIIVYENKRLSYRRETALQGAL